MAINPETQYAGKITPSSPEYPYGKARNITTPGDGTGTPWEAALVNDLFGFQQSLLDEAGIVPTGDPDRVGASQYLDAIKKIFSDRVVRVGSTSEISAYDVPAGYVFSLNDGGKSGEFDVIAGDFSAELAADTLNGIFAPVGGDPTGATKVAKRRYSGGISVQWFGAVPGGAVDSTAAIQAALTFAEGTGLKVYGQNQSYLISEAGTTGAGRNYFFLITDGTKLRNIRFVIDGYTAASYLILKETTESLTFDYEFINVKATLKNPADNFVHNGIRLYGHVGNVVARGCDIRVLGDVFSVIGMENYAAPVYDGVCEGIFFERNKFYSDQQNGIFLLGNQEHVRVKKNKVTSRADNGASKVGIFVDNMETGGYSVPGGDLWLNPIADDGQIASRPIRDVVISGNRVVGFKTCVAAYSAEDCNVINNPRLEAGLDGTGVLVENAVSATVPNHANYDYIVNGNRIEARTGVSAVNTSDSQIKNNRIKGSSVSGGSNLRGVYVFDRSATQTGARSDSNEISGNRIVSIAGNTYTHAIEIFDSPGTNDNALSSNLASGSYSGTPFAGVNKNGVSEFSDNISLDQPGGNVLARVQYTGSAWEVITTSRSFGIDSSAFTWNAAGYLEIDLPVSTGVIIAAANTALTCSVDFIEGAPNICRVRFYDAAGAVVTTESTSMRFILKVGT